MGRLDGKVALVTGAASGIGLACVARFVGRGRARRRRRPRRAARPSSSCRRRRRGRRSRRPTCATRTRSRRRSTRWSPSTAASTRSSPRPGSRAADPRTSSTATNGSVCSTSTSPARSSCASTRSRRCSSRSRSTASAAAIVDDRERRGPRRHRGRQLVQRVEGRGRDPHQEPGDRLRPRRASAPTRSAPGSSRRRCSKACSACRAWKTVRDRHPRGAQARAGSAGPRRSRRSPRSSFGRRVVRHRPGDRRRRRLHRRPRPRRHRACSGSVTWRGDAARRVARGVRRGARARRRLHDDVGRPGRRRSTGPTTASSPASTRTRAGPYASMYRSKLWTMRMFAGFGTADRHQPALPRAARAPAATGSRPRSTCRR